MVKRLHTSQGTLISIEHTPFASGGEGDLFRVVSPSFYSNRVAKIYKPQKQTAEREQKIQFLIKNPPLLQEQDGHYSVLWANEILYENKKFIGFLMPIAEGEELESLLHPKWWKEKATSEWDKFRPENPDALSNRLKLCFNIAAALYQIHSLGNYVLVDMKPANIKVQSKGLISIIDIDSIEIIKQNKILFPAPVATIEYAPAEFHKGISPEKDLILDTWDRFSLAVIFYRLLCGIHPFTGTCHAPYQHCTGLAEMIENGLFPNGKKSNFFRIIPPPHQNFQKLDRSIQDLFLRCFDEGHQNPPLRPSADEWCKVLFSLTNSKPLLRILPSAFASKIDITIYSKPIRFEPQIQIDFPKVEFLDIEPTNKIKAFFLALVNKSQKEKLAENILKQEQFIRETYKKNIEYHKILLNSVDTFKVIQTKILNDEKNAVAQMLRNYAAELSEMDRLVEKCKQDEKQEIQQLLLQKQQKIEQKNAMLVKFYDEQLGLHTRGYEQHKNKLENDLHTHQKMKEAELQKHLLNPQKLVKFRIEDFAKEIFGANLKQIVDNLHQNNIRTAADFLSINRLGSILLHTGTWIHIKGIGLQRAVELDNWRERMEKIENDRIRMNIYQKYAPILTQIEKDLKKREEDFSKLIQPFIEVFEAKKASIETEKKQIETLFHTEKKAIEQRYSDFHATLPAKVKAVEQQYRKQIAQIPHQTSIFLQENLQKHQLFFQQKMQEIDHHIAMQRFEIQKLKQLQQEYKNLL